MKFGLFLHLSLCSFIGIAPAQENDFDGQIVPNDSKVSGWSNFIHPNETEPFRFAPIHRGRKGVLLGVGTFRILFEASLGEFERVVLFDADKGVTEFNRKNLDLIRDAATPERYREALWEMVQGKSEDYALWILEDLAQIVRGKGRGIYFFEDAARYQKIRALALSNRVSTIRGDFQKPETLQEVGRILKSLGLHVSAVSLSNVLPFIVDLQTFTRNLNALPWSEGAVVTMTGEVTAFKGFGFTDWSYLAISPEALLRALSAVPKSLLFQVSRTVSSLFQSGGEVLRDDSGRVLMIAYSCNGLMKGEVAKAPRTNNG